MVLVLLSGDPPIRRVKIVHIYDSSSVNNFFGIKREVFFFSSQTWSVLKC